MCSEFSNNSVYKKFQFHKHHDIINVLYIGLVRLSPNRLSNKSHQSFIVF